MKKKSLGLSREVKHFIIALFVLTIVFAFNDKEPTFIASKWIGNFIYVFFLVFITLLINLMGYVSLS